MGRGLLEKLADQMAIPYLSDLRMTCYWRRLVQHLVSIRAEEYSLSEWKDAIQYILGKTEASFLDGQEAKEFLIRQLEK